MSKFVALIILLIFSFEVQAKGSTNHQINSSTEIELRPANYVENYGDFKVMANNEVRFLELSGTDYVSLKSASSLGSILDFILPSSYGTSGQCLKGNGAGVFSFGDCIDGSPILATDQQVVFGIGSGSGSGKGSFLFDYANDELEIKGSIFLSGNIAGSGTGTFGQIVSQNNVTGSGTGTFGQVVSQNNVTGSGTGSFGNVVSLGNLIGSGSGEFAGNVAIKSQNSLELQDSAGGDYKRLRAHATTTSHTTTLPPTNCAADQVWVDDGSGNLSCADQSGGGGGINLLTDFSFEDALGWTCNTTDQTCAQSTTEVFHEVYSAKLDSSTSQVRNDELCITNTSLENMNGQVSCMVWTASSVFNFCSSDDVTSCLDSKDIAANSAWTRYTATMAVPASGKLCARVTSDSGTTDDIYIDACEFTEFKPNVVANESDTVDYTPTYTGFGTVTVSDVQYSYSGDKVIIHGRFTSGTPTATEARVSLPNNLSVKSNITSTQSAGKWARSSSTSGQEKAGEVLILGGQSYIRFSTTHFDASQNPLSPRNGDGIVIAGEDISFSAVIPVNGLASGVETIAQAAFPATQMKWQQTNCVPTRSASGFDRLADSDCTYAGAEKIGATYDASQTGAVLPISFIPPGKYEFCVNGVIYTERATTDTVCVYRIADVANSKFAGVTNPGSATTSSGTRYEDGFCGVVEYTSPASNVLIEFEANRAVGDGSCNVSAQNTGEGLTLSVKQLSGVIAANLKGLPVGVYQPTVTAASCPGWATTNINVVPYQLPDNSWAADIKVNGTFTSATTCYVSISGLTFANTTITPCAAFKDTPNNWSTAWAQTSSSEIRFVTGAADVSLNANCTAVPLASKPTFVP